MKRAVVANKAFCNDIVERITTLWRGAGKVKRGTHLQFKPCWHWLCNIVVTRARNRPHAVIDRVELLKYTADIAVVMVVLW